MVDYTGLENRRAERHRGFESLSFRKASKGKYRYDASLFVSPSVKARVSSDRVATSFVERWQQKRSGNPSASAKEELNDCWALFLSLKSLRDNCLNGFLFNSVCILYVLLSVSAERRNQERPCCTLRVRTDYDSEKLCCGTRYAQTGPRTDSVTVFQSSYLLPSSLAIATNIE